MYSRRWRSHLAIPESRRWSTALFNLFSVFVGIYSWNKWNRKSYLGNVSWKDWSSNCSFHFTPSSFYYSYSLGDSRYLLARNNRFVPSYSFCYYTRSHWRHHSMRFILDSIEYSSRTWTSYFCSGRSTTSRTICWSTSIYYCLWYKCRTNWCTRSFDCTSSTTAQYYS